MNPSLKGKLLKQIPLKEYTSFRVGGPAKQIYQPSDKSDLIYFLKTLPKNEPLLWLGLGSNLLIRDGGFPGTVILLQGNLAQITLVANNTIQAEAGVSCGTFARFTAKQQLTGGEFFAGIPGTIGGALKMNAGCHGCETWQHVIAVETINRQGKAFTRLPQTFTIQYRCATPPTEEWFLSATFHFQTGDTQTSLATIKTLLAQRKATQPIHLPNCGSVFRNPPGHYAAKLIETCDLKGYRINDASVSDKHANFIINHGAATAKDIEELIYFIQKTVKKQHNIDLIPEVHIVGVSHPT